MGKIKPLQSTKASALHWVSTIGPITPSSGNIVLHETFRPIMTHGNTVSCSCTIEANQTVAPIVYHI